jgi:hypothetical protein
MHADANMLWTILAGLITLAIFSFLYRDNPMYKMAEHIAVGISVGFIVVVYYNNVFKPKVWDNILHKGQYDYLIPLILGIILFTRFLPKHGWMSRYAIAFYIGTSSGLSIAPTLEARVLQQMEGTVRSLVTVVPGNTLATLAGSFGAIFLIVGTLACLIFFLFSVEHRGGVGRVAYFGRLCIMAGFGASFGFTVMARVSLLIGRIHFLTRDFVQALGGLFGG